jgi:magnesium chelatase family protein
LQERLLKNASRPSGLLIGPPTLLLRSLPPVLKTGELALDRRGIVTRFPARIQLVLTTSPCPCAATDPEACTCSARAITRHGERIPHDVLNLVDLKYRIPHLADAELTSRHPESTAAIDSVPRPPRQVYRNPKIKI